MKVVLVSSLYSWVVGFSTFIQSRYQHLSENDSGLKKRKGVGMQIRYVRMKYMSQCSSLAGPIQLSSYGTYTSAGGHSLSSFEGDLKTERDTDS